MARQSTRNCKHERKAVVLPPPRKSSKLPTGQGITWIDHGLENNANSSALRPRAEVSKSRKFNETVSVAGLLKNRGQVVANAKKPRKHKITTPDPPSEPYLAMDFKNGIDEARYSINNEMQATFNSVHEKLLHKLAASKANDESFFERFSSVVTTLSAPLSEEQVETSFTRPDGRRVTEIVQIGKRMNLFKKSVEKDGAKLKEYWKQWEDLQNDFIELGLEVFGKEAFSEGMSKDKKREKGYLIEMELLDSEVNARIEEISGEVEDLTSMTLKALKTSEKEMDKSAADEQTRYLQAIMLG